MSNNRYLKVYHGKPPGALRFTMVNNRYLNVDHGQLSPPGISRKYIMLYFRLISRMFSMLNLRPAFHGCMPW
jgi:hypothetical protein